MPPYRTPIMKLRIGATLLVLAGLLAPVHAQTPQFKKMKSVESFHAILDNIQHFYVDSTQTDSLVYMGIHRMLGGLDPYTVFIPEEETEDLEMMTTGSYGGIGAIIRKEPGRGVTVVEPYENSPAWKMGMVPGDEILAIDGQSTRDLSVEQASSRMKGTPGSTVSFTIKKLKTADTVRIDVVRERVRLSDIALATRLQDSIGFIRLTGFTQDAGKEFKAALQGLEAQGPLAGLVIDLRGNGGGLLSEAVNILSLFVPKKTAVVSSRGRVEAMNYTYTTKEAPLYPSLPLMVLVNSASASSSEIVAGALQDLDRAVVLGQRTYGKGLVQSIRELPYGGNLKVTTAKYYTPSGRCVQAIDYTHRNEDGSVGLIPDSLTRPFATRAGRTVYDGGGITPDVKVEAPTLNRIVLDLYARNYFFDFALEYFRTHDSIAPAPVFRLSDAEYDRFVAFMEGKEFENRSATERLLDQFQSTAAYEGLDSLATEGIATLKEALCRSKRENLYLLKDDICNLIEEEICGVYYLAKGQLEHLIHRNDPQLAEGLRLLGSAQEFRALLAPPADMGAHM